MSRIFHRSANLVVVSWGAALAILTMWPQAWACTPHSDESLPSADTLSWEMALSEEHSRLPDTCIPAAASVVRALSAKPDKKVEIVAYADSPGSISLGLARVSALADQLREAILRASAKMRVRIDMSLLPMPDAEPGSPLTGRILLRVVNRIH